MVTASISSMVSDIIMEIVSRPTHVHSSDHDFVGDLEVPTLEIVSNPTLKLSEIKARRFYIVDRAQITS